MFVSMSGYFVDVANVVDPVAGEVIFSYTINLLFANMPDRLHLA